MISCLHWEENVIRLSNNAVFCGFGVENRFLVCCSFSIRLTQGVRSDPKNQFFCLQLAIKKLTVPTVSVQCMTCMEVNNFVIPSYPIKFIGYCGNCGSRSSPQYKWTVFDDSGNELVLNKTSTSTGNTFVPLFNAVRKGALSGSNRINIARCPVCDLTTQSIGNGPSGQCFFAWFTCYTNNNYKFTA